MTDAIKEANFAQRKAADPSVSAFVDASAGSGKTKLLTDRLLRLMLEGVSPQRILCLTFTRAAAAEMAIRLRDRLGTWAIVSDAALNVELASLGYTPDEGQRARARALFGLVLDLPGGMRIATIHSFCQSLLRRFPLEAGIPPHFAIAESTEVMLRRRAVRERILLKMPDESALSLLAEQQSEQQFAELTDILMDDPRGALARLFTQYETADAIAGLQRDALGVLDVDGSRLWDAAVTPPQAEQLTAALQIISENSSPRARTRASNLLAWIAMSKEDRCASWAQWRSGFLTGNGAPRAKPAFLSKALDEAQPALFGVIEAEQRRLGDVCEQVAASTLAELSASLLRLLFDLQVEEATEKRTTGRFDHADLITKTAEVLKDPGAAWVLYKLDGGIDHLLLDEVQDIAPSQWSVIDAIGEEFFSGLNARNQNRTIFAVGDRKQSIYGFQGADLASFDAWRMNIAAKARSVGARWHDGVLATSFRSVAPVLALVDSVFSTGTARHGVVEAGAHLVHSTSRQGQGGAVMLWPLAPAADDPPPEPWEAATAYTISSSPRQRLATALASWIEQAIGRYELPARGRTLQAGDILILVRVRNEFGPALTRALKQRGVPVAGLDRIFLTEARAVADMIALANALILPEDDVAFATFLTSPLGGLSDESLMELAIDRSGSLHSALLERASLRQDWAAAETFFSSLRKRVDFVSPYKLFAEALGPLGGRARLLARLGPEQAEPIDEFLATAIEFETSAPPSMQGFLAAISAAAAEVKREAEASSNAVRIMTVHGAKGLQAPLVILPDTTGTVPQRDTIHWVRAPHSKLPVPIFCPRVEMRSRVVEAAVAEAHTLAQEEANRLLYVALTRAEDGLIICGAAPRKPLPEGSWYRHVADAFARLKAVPIAIDLPWTSHALTLEASQTAPPDRLSTDAMRFRPSLPDWIGPSTGWCAEAPPRRPQQPDRLVPSRVAEGYARDLASSSPLAAGRRRERQDIAMARGRLTHLLLQHLPDLEPEARESAARAFLGQPGHGIDAPLQEMIVSEVMAILQHPELTPLFSHGSRGEAPVAGIIDGVEIAGVIDRLVVGQSQILIADYKTDRAVPSEIFGVPLAYRAQIGAYVRVLQTIYPDRPIIPFLIWTATARVMRLTELEAKRD